MAAGLFVCVLVVGVLVREGKPQITSDGCGTSKGCYRQPVGCTGLSDCQYFLSWTADGAGNNIFRMTGINAASYIALGFSKSGVMSNSDVYACTSNNEVVRSRNTIANINEPKQLKGVSDVSASVTNGQVLCTFTRQASRTDNDDTYFDLAATNTYTIIMAKSNMALMADGNINYHFSNRIINNEKTSFQEFPKMNGNERTTPVSETLPPKETTITSEGCGSNKGCFRQPVGCTEPTDCSFFASWTSDNAGNNIFSMTGMSAGSYIALGFSKSGKMSNSDVYACTSNNEVVRSRNTIGNSNDPSPVLKGVSDVKLSIINGQIECVFTRQSTLNDNDDTYFDLAGNNTYYVIMAKSSGNLQADGNINIHTARSLGQQLVSFQAFTEIGGEADGLGIILQKTHGCLMVAAWVLFASLGITVARFYKPMWPRTKICGKPVWFVLHRTLMVCTFVCTVAAFVVIFVHKKGFVEKTEDLSGLLRFVHAVLGTVVTFLVILNPIMAICRPHPGEPRRTLFNWAHWAVGTCAHLSSMATICIGLGVGDVRPLISGLPPYLFWVVVVFIAFHFVLWLLFQIEKCTEIRQGDHNIRKNDDGSAQFQEELIPEDVRKPLGSATMSGLFVVYVIGAFVTTIFLIFTIAGLGLSL